LSEPILAEPSGEPAMGINRTIQIQYSNDRRFRQGVIFDAKFDVNLWVYVHLKKYLAKHHINIETIDDPKTAQADAFIFINTPYLWHIDDWKLILKNPEKCVLFMLEPPIVNPFNYFRWLHRFFYKCGTWNTEFVDNKKYFYHYFAQSSFGIELTAKPFAGKKFLTLINGNKFSPIYMRILARLGMCQGRELYSERIRSIDYFESNIPEKFDLYGHGWNKPAAYNFKEKLFGFRKYKTYKGTIDNKIELLSNYKFSLCFENLTDVKGYFTEKLFDCLKAKCIPIYWGASDVETYIPPECFIDFRKFNDYGELLRYLESMDEDRYNEYIFNIEKLLKSERFLNAWFELGHSQRVLELLPFSTAANSTNF
jgi:alpha(1,3/1,4) fucosyltransferase